MVIAGSYEVAVKMMGDMTFLTALLNFPKEQINDETVELLQVGLGQGGLRGVGSGCGFDNALIEARGYCEWMLLLAISFLAWTVCHMSSLRPSIRSVTVPHVSLASPTLPHPTSIMRAHARPQAMWQVGFRLGCLPTDAHNA
jgi:hypothetical protein